MPEFTFKVYNRRRDSELTYRLEKTKSGWHIRHIAINGDCDAEGAPFFYTNFEQDYIQYPSGFGNYLSWIWEQLDIGDLSVEAAQARLQELADWVSECERSAPQWKGWNA